MKTLFQKISKPHLVDLLRLSDHNRWLHPRIRYASVRSKPELITDLLVHFRLFHLGTKLVFHPRKRVRACPIPQIEYDLQGKQFLVEGRPQDIPRLSRKRPSFSISRLPVTLTF